MSDTTPDSVPSPARFALHALKYGSIAGLIGGAWMIGEYALGFQTERPEIGRWTFLASMIVPIAAVILGMTAWRNNALGGRIRFVQAFGMALAVGLSFALLMAAAGWLHAAVLEPDLIERALDRYAVTAAQQPEAKPEAIAAQVELWKRSTTPVTYAQGVFTRSLVLSFFVGLLAAITVPKKRPGLD